jgi:hypothetical protein
MEHPFRGTALKISANGGQHVTVAVLFGLSFHCATLSRIVGSYGPVDLAALADGSAGLFGKASRQVAAPTTQTQALMP